MVWQAPDAGKGKYTLIKDVEDFQTGVFDKPLPCFGCGIGWFSFLVGFLCPLMWYYATFIYFGNHYRKDPRERAGLAASAIAVSAPSLCLSLSPLVNNFRNDQTFSALLNVCSYPCSMARLCYCRQWYALLYC
ncbi:protein MEI2-like 5-like isoform X1 [Hibiscus syriacus]|uniref:Protein MEI2-like 5-like isoform X1 n=1 Tax=Hibiscus syriacus TaxID=106335 RepID=A0A6A2YEN4_HIBSY|nr:protein MEI2-like 5-like isoform X1 [Hibiscus syriacus]